MNVLVINYGMGNLASVRRAFEECGATVLVSENPDDLEGMDRIVLPGVGAFPDGMAQLIVAGWPAKLRAALQNPEVRLLGICLGMQLLADRGFEGRETPGLGLIPGTVTKLQAPRAERIPHVGWNEIRAAHSASLLDEIPDGTDFYFVHSYHFQPKEPEDILARTPYCGDFASIVGRSNVAGTQFHPEKSSKQGFQLIRNFLSC